MKTYKINPENENLSIGVLIERIDKGYELQKINEELINERLTETQILKYNSSIILAPDYQREYRFTLEDEVKLIESVLVGIPIPPIFLATDKYKEVRVTNVVDGQHRLRALYRFYNNAFSLTGLTLLKGLEGKKFKDLDLDMKSDFKEQTLLITIFKDFPGKDFELEIFNRYNKGTKPLSPQEIRHAVYNSEFNRFINAFTMDIYNNYKTDDKKNKLKIAYNVTKDRLQKKKLQEGLFVILSILENGIDVSNEKSLDYAEGYMKQKAEEEEKDKESLLSNFNKVRSIFNEFNTFILRIQEICEFPFSKEIYGISSRNYKFQISIAMILAGVFNKIKDESNTVSLIINDDLFREKFMLLIKESLLNSFLEDSKYNASSTNSREISKLVDEISLKIVDLQS